MLPSPTQPLWSVFFVVFLIFLSPSASNNVTLSGDADLTDTSVIALTQKPACLSPQPTIGRVFYISPFKFLDSSTNTTASFSSKFSFRISPIPSCPYGDGFTFLIASKSDSVNLLNGYMGLPGQDSFVAVEFDTSFNPSLGDINDNHIGVDVNTASSLASVDAFSKGIDLRSGREMNAWVEYRDPEKVIRVWVGYSPEAKPQNPVLVVKIDLSLQLREFMHVGFSASNSRGSATHFIRQWTFKTYGLLSSAAPVNAAGELDCLMCSPTDLSAENGNFDFHHGIGELVLVLGGVTLFIISVFAAVVIVILCMIRRKKLKTRGFHEGRVCRGNNNRVPKRLSLSEIKSATKGFSQRRIVGEGGAATVYEGSLPSLGEVAVKRFTKVDQISPFRNQFATEFAAMLGCLRHKHLIQLQGWCCEGNELVLVYEYMANGSLDKILHRNNNALTIFLTWERRRNIVLGVASALIYLHEECERQIIHRDVKACNIMLDDDFNAKLGDFGLAEVYEHSSVITREATIPAGTMGYLAPEYVYSGIPTVKTDVYSFGVVVLEVASGKRPVDDDGALLVDWVWELWGKERLIEAADYKLKGKFSRLEMERMLAVGLACVHPNHEKRPTVKEAARMIRGEATLPALPARKPRMSIQCVLPEGSEGLLNFDADENRGVDDTPWLTPKTHF
ncbi:Non-specific serine/threonine protein kinase [Bertholletia excelsa]